MPDRAELAAVFTDAAVAAAYQCRPPYPAEVFDQLKRLLAEHPRPRRVIDVGAGDGALARPLAVCADRVDALDISPPMLAAGACRPGGDASNLRRILGAAETADLDGPYAMVTAGASLHWMAWRTTLSRLAAAMSPMAVLVIADRGYNQLAWRDQLTEIIIRHTRSPDFDPGFSLAGELSNQGLLQVTGQASWSEPFGQSIEAYIEQFQSTSSLARKWMQEAESAAFDAAVRTIVEPYSTDGMLDMQVVAELAWGRPTVAADANIVC